jgi:hypothetical protein
MTPQDALTEVLARVGAANGAVVYFAAAELRDWPVETVSTLKAHKVLIEARPANSVVCSGCERQCVMPVHVFPTQDRAPSAFVVCDKRSDINRVEISADKLDQFAVAGSSIADLVAGLLDVRRPSDNSSNSLRWEIGLLKGRKHASNVVMLADSDLQLLLAGRSVLLSDVLEMKSAQLTIDLKRLVRFVDSPAAGGGDIESAAQRRKRLTARVRAEKAKGTRGFLQIVAAEEGFSVPRLKQLIYRAAPNSAKDAHRTPRSMPKGKKPLY